MSPSGGGQVRVDGKLLTAARAAWELEHGPLPNGARVLSCVDEPACVRLDHLRLDRSKVSGGASSTKRAARGAGTMAPLSPGVWRIGITAGVDRLGRRRRTFRTVHGTRTEAAKALAALVTEVGDGDHLLRQNDKLLTVDALVAWYVEFAREERGLDHSTLTGYADVYSRWLKEPIGQKRASSITMAELDKAFGRMRRAGLSRSRMNNARALLSGAFKWGKRHGKVTRNPVDGFELPTSAYTPRHTTAPELDDLLRLLATAEEHDELLAPILNLGATTGLRRGELSGLRRDRLHLDRYELVVDNAINDAGGVVVEKQTKTRSSRVVSLDEATTDLLRQHLAEMDARATRVVWDDGAGRRIRVQPRPYVRQSPTTGAVDTPHASVAQGTRPHRRKLRCHHPCAAQMDHNRTDGRRIQSRSGEWPSRSHRAGHAPPLLDAPAIRRQSRRSTSRRTNPRPACRRVIGATALWIEGTVSDD